MASPIDPSRRSSWLPVVALAAVLGGALLIGVVRVQRAAEWTKPAWQVYKFSLLYLALLFVAMALDPVIA